MPWGWLVNMSAAAEIGLTEEMIAEIHTCEQMEEYLAAYEALHPEVYPYVIGDASWPKCPGILWISSAQAPPFTC